MSVKYFDFLWRRSLKYEEHKNVTSNQEIFESVRPRPHGRKKIALFFVKTRVYLRKHAFLKEKHTFFMKNTVFLNRNTQFYLTKRAENLCRMFLQKLCVFLKNRVFFLSCGRGTKF